MYKIILICDPERLLSVWSDTHWKGHKPGSHEDGLATSRIVSICTVLSTWYFLTFKAFLNWQQTLISHLICVEILFCFAVNFLNIIASYAIFPLVGITLQQSSEAVMLCIWLEQYSKTWHYSGVACWKTNDVPCTVTSWLRQWTFDCFVLSQQY